MALDANTAVSRFVVDSSWDDPQHREGWYFRSDHLPYARAGVPALFFTTLLHPDYHTPLDNPDRIDIAKLAKMTRWMYATGRAVAEADKRARVRSGASSSNAAATRPGTIVAVERRVDSSADPIVAFYSSGPDRSGRTLGEILAWDDERLEAVHDYIQWVFPTRQPSGVNPFAPLVTDGTVRAFAGDAALRDRLRQAFDRMLIFYGLARSGERVAIDAPRFGPARGSG